MDQWTLLRQRKPDIIGLIEGEGDEGMAGADAAGEIWSQPLEQRQDDWRLYPEGNSAMARRVRAERSKSDRIASEGQEGDFA